MEDKIIVMGGSFNPPTIAHYRLMTHAMEALGAVQGIFVPVSQDYLKQKMGTSASPLCLSQQFRLDMLLAMCAGDLRLDISDLEFRHPDWDTDQTMDALQEQYPGAKLYLLLGSDKLALAEYFAQHTDFLSSYGIALVCREGAQTGNGILESLDGVIWIKPPEGLESVSSTAVRAHFFAGNLDLAQPMLPESVWALFSRLDPQDYQREASRFRGKYEFSVR